jgi:hypothetical protein
LAHAKAVKVYLPSALSITRVEFVSGISGVNLILIIRGSSESRNVQKQNRRWSSCLAMIVAEHSAESLTPFESGVRFANGVERPQQAVF